MSPVGNWITFGVFFSSYKAIVLHTSQQCGCLLSIKQLYKIEIQCSRWPQARFCGLALKEAAVLGTSFHPQPMVLAPWELLQDCSEVKSYSKWKEIGKGEQERARLQFPCVHWAWAFSISAKYEESWPCFKDLRKRRQFKTKCLLSAMAVPLAGCNLSVRGNGNAAMFVKSMGCLSAR